MIKLTEQEIEKGRSPKGGFTKRQLARWGVPWPPPKGWKDALLAGDDPAKTDFADAHPSWPHCSAHDLLRNVVLAVVEHGHASDLYEFPEVLAYFGAQIPRDPNATYHVVSDNGFDA